MPRPELTASAIAVPVGPVPAYGQRNLPLQGLTILAVEDSRYACEALRLIAQRAGARLRRAETLETARAHLRTYRPDVAIVDLGLPDGRGEALIRELVLALPRTGAIIGMSGLPSGRGSALAAGADGFLEKPLAGYRAFCEMVSRFLPDRVDLPGAELTLPLPAPDLLALQDDLERAAQELAHDPDRARQRYLTGFLAGIARVTQDQDLARASDQAAQGPDGMAPLRALLTARLAGRTALIAPDPGAGQGAPSCPRQA